MDLETALRILRTKGWFSRIAPRFQTVLAAEATVFSAQKGETIFHFGDPGAGLFGIAAGAFVLSCPREDESFLPVVTFGSGYWLGDVAALSGKPGLVSIDIREDLAGVHIPAAQLRRLVRDMPELYRAFYELNRMNLALAMRLMAALTAETALEKVALRLLILSDYSAREGGWMALTNEELATQLGISVPSTRRALQKLTEMGSVERGYGRLRLTDRDIVSKLNEI